MRLWTVFISAPCAKSLGELLWDRGTPSPFSVLPGESVQGASSVPGEDVLGGEMCSLVQAMRWCCGQTNCIGLTLSCAEGEAGLRGAQDEGLLRCKQAGEYAPADGTPTKAVSLLFNDTSRPQPHSMVNGHGSVSFMRGTYKGI
jgi:hypothetical protein